MNRNASPFVKVLLVGVFFAITMLLSGVCFHHDAPPSLTPMQKTAQNVSKIFRQDATAWNALAKKNPLLMLRLTSHR